MFSKTNMDNLKNTLKDALRKFLKPKLHKHKKRADVQLDSSMEELKRLVLEGMNKDPSLYSTLEKADILEMAVNYLQNSISTQADDTAASVAYDCACVCVCGAD
ncbi:PREDICTED: transcription factor HES-2-like [Priapulus caudatus]|uniref:Transcription factor HES-2-like n=1 Tax=Priapulus caudatus TaxID=37621 RepID=A0ABM1EU03_PRICU|nr:PREDICTED: transcription factor HES-2-like [Priapulus caudatus]